MSSLWTPGGEHAVGRERDAAPGPADPDGAGGPGEDLDDLEVQAAEMQAEMDAVRAQLASVPAARVVANHAMGLFELAAIHLSRQPPDLTQAVLAIDAMASLVEGLGDRLEDAAPTLADALAQIRMAFVQVKSSGAAAG